MERKGPASRRLQDSLREAFMLCQQEQAFIYCFVLIVNPFVLQTCFCFSCAYCQIALDFNMI